MTSSPGESTLSRAAEKLRRILEEKSLLDAPVEVWAKPLTPEEAIGNPQRRDYPIIEGKERVIEAHVANARGHAFTDSAGNYQGTLDSLMNLSLDDNRNRAFFIAAMNAALKYLGLTERTIHCRDEDPERCAREIASYINEKFGRVHVGQIGLNPAIAQALVETFGEDRVRITDLNREQIGRIRFGVEIWDGRTRTDELVEKSDFIILTGTTLVNGSFDAVLRMIENNGKNYLIYGVTCAGVCSLLQLPRICPYGRDE
jgi:uncharacterized protein (DUF4213/DUF364 family)